MSCPSSAVDTGLLFLCWDGNDDWVWETTLARLQLPRTVQGINVPTLTNTRRTPTRSRAQPRTMGDELCRSIHQDIQQGIERLRSRNLKVFAAELCVVSIARSRRRQHSIAETRTRLHWDTGSSSEYPHRMR
jgi:hypothetical protein